MTSASWKDLQLRLTQTPVWKVSVDTGGMFDSDLMVFEDLEPGELPPFLAVTTDGWGAGWGVRKPSLEEAKAYTYELLEKYMGVKQ